MDHRINRNIVECKVDETPTLGTLTVVLIETLWNVKTNERSQKRIKKAY